MSLITSALSHMVVTSVLLGGLVKAKAIECALTQRCLLDTTLLLLRASRAFELF